MKLFKHQSLGSAALVIAGAFALAFSFFAISVWEFNRTEAHDRARIVQLADAFVAQYSEFHSGGMPIPASFRRMGLENFLDTRKGDTTHAPLKIRVPGPPGLELGAVEPDPRVAAQITAIAKARDTSIHDEVRLEHFRVIGRSIFPTIAKSESCVACHNRELGGAFYKTGDIMGAFVVESDLTGHVVRTLFYAGTAFGLMLLGYHLLARRDTRRTRALVELEGQVKLERQKREAEAHTNFVLSHDSLTGLVRRAVFMERLQTGCPSQRGRVFFLALVDLDDFKTINDTMGHDTGDAVLVAVADRLKQIAAQGSGLAARLGGDEFALMMPESEDVPSMQDLGSRIVSTVCHEVGHNGFSIRPSCSVGLSVCGAGALHNTGDLLKFADAALYAAKNDGKNQYRQFNDQILKDLKRRSFISATLPQAIRRGDLDIALQPKVCLASGKVVEFETLARWQLNGEPVPPDEFVRIAEETGTIVELDLAILAKGARFAAGASQTSGTPVRISSNISALGFRTPKMADKIVGCLMRAGLPLEQLTVEVTESVLVENVASVNESLTSLRACGVRVALDDFGTGYSSLRYLQQLVFDEIKIDRSFLKDITHDTEKLFLFKKIVEMAKGLNKEVVVEGIEDKHQLELVQRTGVQLGQGYYFSKPMSQEACLRYVHSPALHQASAG